MASVKGTELTNIDAAPTVKISSEVAGGKLRVFHGTYEAASLASGSDISIARIPTNATIHDVIIKCDALGGSSTLKIGTAADDDLFIAATGTWNVAGQTQIINRCAYSNYYWCRTQNNSCHRCDYYNWWCNH